jgi:pimeloyl-ACP methyl ester carboxylesterase
MKSGTAAKVQANRYLRLVLPPVLIITGGLVSFIVFLYYRSTHAGIVPEPINPSNYVLPSQDVVVVSADGSQISAWWITGENNKPSIVLAPGFGMSRADVLSLAAVLNGQGYHLLIYNQRGASNSSRKSSTFGLSESDDMLGALRFVKSQPNVSKEKMGIWAVDVGARAALKAAASVATVRTIVADCAFQSVMDFMDYRLSEDLGVDNGFLKFGCHLIFKLTHITMKVEEKLPLNTLSDRSILFIKGENRQGLEQFTDSLYKEIQPNKEMLFLKASRVRSMSGEEIRNYDKRVADFFSLNLQ